MIGGQEKLILDHRFLSAGASSREKYTSCPKRKRKNQRIGQNSTHKHSYAHSHHTDIITIINNSSIT